MDLGRGDDWRGRTKSSEETGNCGGDLLYERGITFKKMMWELEALKHK